MRRRHDFTLYYKVRGEARRVNLSTAIMVDMSDEQ
jgi:hypothetical protein